MILTTTNFMAIRQKTFKECDMKDSIFLAIGANIVIAGLLTANWLDAKPYRDLLNNPKVELYCQFIDGERQVDRSKITDFIEGTWYFTNGSAKRCRIIK